MKTTADGVRRKAGVMSIVLKGGIVRPGDPWSGHISFPGGMMTHSDTGPVGSAIREADSNYRAITRRRAPMPSDRSK